MTPGLHWQNRHRGFIIATGNIKTLNLTHDSELPQKMYRYYWPEGLNETVSFLPVSMVKPASQSHQCKLKQSHCYQCHYRSSGRSVTGNSPTYGRIPSIILKTDKKSSFGYSACQTKMQNGFYRVVFLHFSY